MIGWSHAHLSAKQYSCWILLTWGVYARSHDHVSPSYFVQLFQNEFLVQNEFQPIGELTRVHMNGFAQLLVLTQKNKVTQNWSIPRKVVSKLAQNCDFNLRVLQTEYSNIDKFGFSIFFLFLTFTRTEKERHANQSTKKKTSDHLFGFSGKLSIQELGYNDYGKGSRLINGNLTKCGRESSRKI